MSEFAIYLICIVGGFLAGVINTLAGNGSTITLGILTEVIGLPPSIANGTNRIGVLFQTLTSYLGLKRNISIKLSSFKGQIIVMFFGAIIGAIVAVLISNEQFKVIYKIMMVVMLFVILAKPSKWISPDSSLHSLIPYHFLLIIYFFIGFYGGFIQMGMGLLFLATMVLLDKKDLMTSNVLKNFIVLVFTSVILGIFVYKDLVSWKDGLLIASGQATGGWVTGRYIAKSKQANKIAYFVLLSVVVMVVIKMFFF